MQKGGPGSGRRLMNSRRRPDVISYSLVGGWKNQLRKKLATFFAGNR